jgi:hypothetical protein
MRRQVYRISSQSSSPSQLPFRRWMCGISQRKETVSGVNSIQIRLKKCQRVNLLPRYLPCNAMASRNFCVTNNNYNKFRALAVSFSMPQQPTSGLGLLTVGVSRSQTEYDCSERVISLSQMQLPTQQTHQNEHLHPQRYSNPQTYVLDCTASGTGIWRWHNRQ